MKMELIQPFINSADAVLAQGLQCSTAIGSRGMEEEAYRRKGVAAMVWVTGDIEGRIIIDLDPEKEVRVASKMAGAELPESDSLVRETACELANQGTGNAITALNDQGFHFRVHPPILHTEDGSKSSEDTEALVIRFETASGSVFMNIALRHHRPRQGERAVAAGQRASPGRNPSSRSLANKFVWLRVFDPPGWVRDRPHANMHSTQGP